VREQCDIVVEIFYQEYSKALSFLEEVGFERSVVDDGLVQSIVYSKDQVDVVVSLDVRDIAIASLVRVCSRGLQGKGFLYDLLDTSKRTDPEIQMLHKKLLRFTSERVYRKTVIERTENLVRPMISASAELDAAILRKYRDAVIMRALEIAKQLYGLPCGNEDKTIR
jgi:hypothetical protein